MENNNKTTSKYFVQELITFVFKNTFSIFAVAVALSLLFIVLNIFAANVLSPKKYLKASIFIDKNVIQSSIDRTSYDKSESLDDEFFKETTINFMNLLNEDLIKRSLETFYNNYSVKQVYPYMEFTPGEENLNKVYNALMGDEIYKYIKILSLDQKSLHKISKDVVKLSKNYFTIVLNLTDSNISADDGKMIVSGIISELNKAAMFGTSSLKVSELDPNLKILNDDVGILKKIFFLNKKIRQVDQNIEMLKGEYSNFINNLELNDADLNMDLIKYQFANIVINFPEAIEMLNGNNELEITKYKEKILSIDRILNDLNTRSPKTQLSNETSNKAEIVLGENILNQLLSMESEINLTSYRTKLYNDKIRLENELSDFRGYIYIPPNVIDASYKSEEKLADLSSQLRDIILVNNEFYKIIERNVANANLFSFSNKMSITENNQFISLSLIKNTTMFFGIALILNIFVVCGYFSIYRSD